MLKPEEIARLQQIKRLVEEILREPPGELRHSFAEKVLRELDVLCKITTSHCFEGEAA